VLAAVVLGLLPAGALAHAQLEATTPAQGTVVRAAPSTVTLQFDEPVEGNFGAVRVFGANGQRVDQGDAFHPNSVGSRLAVHLKPGLADGTYTTTWRVVSADGHIVSSGFTFSIGHAGAAPSASVDQLLGSNKTGPVTTAAYTVTRAVQFAAIALAIGALLFWLFLWPRATGDQEAGDALLRRVRRLVLLAAGFGALSAAVGIVLEGAEAAGLSFFSALKWSIVDNVLGTRFGTVWGFGLIAWLVLAVLAAVLLRRREERGVPAALAFLPLIPVVYLALLPALGGHGDTQHPIGVMFPANAIHVAAMGAWVGGLVTLVVCLPAATRAVLPERRSAVLAGALGRFSPLALAAVGAIAVTGLVQAYVEVRSVHNLVSTGFGRDVLAKMVLLLALIAIGAWHRSRGLPGLRSAAQRGEATGRTGMHVRNALRAEVLLVAGVLGVTGALSGAAPAIEAAQGPYNVTRHIGGARMELSIDPARAGANVVHVYLFDSRTGAQYAGAKQLTLAASLPGKGIGPITQDASLAGPGHFTMPAFTLTPAGTWRIVVTMRVSAFDEDQTTLKVPIH